MNKMTSSVRTLRRKICMRCFKKTPAIMREGNKANYCEPCLEEMVKAQENQLFLQTAMAQNGR